VNKTGFDNITDKEEKDTQAGFFIGSNDETSAKKRPNSVEKKPVKEKPTPEEKDTQAGFFTGSNDGTLEEDPEKPKPQDNSFLHGVGEYGKSFAKGTAEGVNNLAEFGKTVRKYASPLSPLYSLYNHYNPEEPSKEPKETFTEKLDKLLPNDGEEDFFQRAGRRGLGELPTALALSGGAPVGMAIRALAAGFAVEGTKSLGGGELAQTAASLATYLGPDLAGNLIAKGSKAEFVRFSRSWGMTEKETAPLLNSLEKTNFFGLVADKGQKTQGIVQRTKGALDRVYRKMSNSPEAQDLLKHSKKRILYEEISEVNSSFPRASRTHMDLDIADFKKKEITFGTMQNLWKKINANQVDFPELNALKGPLAKAMETINPKLTNDFLTLNKMYTSFYPLRTVLMPTVVEKFVSASAVYGGVGALGGLLMGHPGPLIGIVGAQAGRSVAREILTRPHLQQLGQKLIESINNNKFVVAKKLLQSYSNNIRKISPEIAEELDGISDEDLQNLNTE